MKNNVDSKLLLGLVIGAAVGVTIGYLAATDKKEQILDELNSFVGKIKESVSSAVSKYKKNADSPADNMEAPE
jgi:NAD/NADP transhydrogenase beta subunit